MAPNSISAAHSKSPRLLKDVGQRKEKRNGRQKQKTRLSQSASSSSSKLISRSKNEQNSTSNTEEISQHQLADSPIDSSLNTYTSPYSMSPYSMNMSPLSMMQYGPSMGYGMNMGFGPLSTINQYLFSFQSFIFAIGQAVQIVGMNTHQLHQLYDQLTAMVDQGLHYINEMKTLSIQEVATKNLSDEERRRRRRLKAIRWGLLFSASYASFWTILKWYKKRRDFKRKKRLITDGGEMLSYGNRNMHSRAPTLQSSPQHSFGSMNMMSSPPSMYGAHSNYGYGYSQPHQQYYY